MSLETQLESLAGFATVATPELHALYAAPKALSLRFRDFASWARRLNHSFPTLELVLLGASGAGKSALAEAIVGLPCCPIATSTKRAVHFQLIDDPKATAAKFIVRDSQGEFACLLPEQAAGEIKKRNKRSLEPLFVQIEYCWGYEVTIVDTPAVRTPTDVELWTSLPSTAERVFICVEPCPTDKQRRPNTRVTDTLTLLPMVRRLDPAMSRTICVMTRFDSFLDSFCGDPSVVDATLGSSSQILFATLPSDEIRTAAYAHKDVDDFFKSKLLQYDSRDAHALRSWFDMPAGCRLGMTSIRARLFSLFERHLNGIVPDLSRAFGDHSTALLQKVSLLKGIQAQWTTENVRSFACEYSTRYLRFVDDLIGGSTLGNPHVRGQTLKEEEQETGLSWASAVSGIETTPSSSIPQTPRADSSKLVQQPLRLYGAPQLFRLLDDFRAFALKLEMPSVADSELSITSVDPAWTASEIARTKVEQQFVPLMHQLLDRSFQVLKRAASIADSVVDDYVATGSSTKHEHAPRPTRALAPSRSLLRVSSSLSASVLSGEQEAPLKTVASHLKAQPRRDSRLEPLLQAAPNNKEAKAPVNDVVDSDLQGLDLLQEHNAATNVAALTAVITQREFPAFSAFLKQSYLFGLNSLQRKCMQRCEDEFYGAHTLYWELTGGVDPLALAGMGITERQSSVKRLVSKLYAEIKSRLIEGFVRNVQTCFLSQASFLELMKSVVADVSTLSEDAIVDMFKVDAIVRTLSHRVSSLERKCAALTVARARFALLDSIPEQKK